jgi:glutamine synthetase
MAVHSEYADSVYALTNPICLLVDKPREEFTREDLLSVIERKQIERITLHYTALDGKYKELKVPVSSRLQAERLLADGERVDGSSLFKGMVESTLSDLYVAPVYKSAFLNPFGEPSLEVTCRYLTRESTLVPFAPDSILQNAASLFRRNSGCDLWALGELEFFLLSDPASNLYPLPRQRGYHASGPFVKSGAVLDEMVRYLMQITGAIKYAHSEVGGIDEVRSDLDEIKGKCGEQLEMHMEVRREGHNAMLHMGVLSEEARRVLGGLCTYADSLTAFGNTVSSAYLRLVPNQEAPTRICWSDMNRSAMIRVPLGWAQTEDLAANLNPQQTRGFHAPDSRQTVELRSPDGSAMTHLLLAGIAMAAEWGITHKESLAIAERLYIHGSKFKDEKLQQSLPVLPRSCVESARFLETKRELYEREGIFPPSVISYMAELLRAEGDENMNRYLSDLPADDRLHETRKIMHKDLHRH